MFSSFFGTAAAEDENDVEMSSFFRCGRVRQTQFNPSTPRSLCVAISGLKNPCFPRASFVSRGLSHCRGKPRKKNKYIYVRILIITIKGEE